MKILLIDDDAQMREMIATVLSRAGFAVVEADDGKSGLETFRQGGIDIVITDIVMPEMEGIELTMKLRRSAPSLPIIVISGGGRQSGGAYTKMATHLGATHALNKPFRPAELLALIDAIRPPPPRPGD